MSAALLVYAILAVAMVVLLPVVLTVRIRNGLRGEAGAGGPPQLDGQTAAEVPLGTDADVPARDPLEDDRREVERQKRRAELHIAAENAARTHDRILEQWIAHAQGLRAEQEQQASAHPPTPGAEPTAEVMAEERLLDALDAAHMNRVDPHDPGLDHYVVGVYVTRVHDLEEAWRAYPSNDESPPPIDVTPQ